MLVSTSKLKLPPSPLPVVHGNNPSRTQFFRLILISLTGLTMKLLVSELVGGNVPETGALPIVIFASAVLP